MTPRKAVDAAAVSRAVWHVVANKGIEGTSIRAVAQEAGCSTGLLMYRFPTRGGLLEHARRLMLERTTARADALEATQSDPVERLRDVLSSALPIDQERAEEARVWLGFAAAAVTDPALAAVHREGNRRWLERIERLVTDASAQPMEPAAIAASVASLASVVDGLSSFAVLDPERYPSDLLTRSLDSAIDSALRQTQRGTP